MWDFDVNADNLIDNFAAAIETDRPSAGSWKLDYEEFCKKFNVVPCPNIVCGVDQNQAESCKVINAIVDLSSWRAMLLACCATGSKVIDISVHGSRLSPQHISDLATALNKITTCRSVKLQYLDWKGDNGINETNSAAYQNALISLLSDATWLESVSLNGNNFTAEFMAPVLASLAQSFKLVSLSFSNNFLNDDSVRQFLKAVRCCSNIKLVCFANNQITGECLTTLAELLNGTEQNAEDEAAVKANSKAIADKNKAIKELNKKRKKANLPDLKEITPSLEVGIKREKTMYLVNRTLKRVDFSGNMTMKIECVQALNQALADCPQTVPLPQAAATFQVEGDMKLLIDFRNCFENGGDVAAAAVAANAEPQAWVEVLTS